MSNQKIVKDYTLIYRHTKTNTEINLKRINDYYYEFDGGGMITTGKLRANFEFVSCKRMNQTFVKTINGFKVRQKKGMK